ncbi:FAD-binding monooxygenase [Arthrobacter caoxuetaonis]|uniref:FAD-binding monooxygenase n=1 Tax=Arthrobacter caoxuetaonis TaxID=2886935 RepID=A0A9X1MFN6_9MICC|nr:FAD-binding monooxygenase [Arthrobacter caoxuetaonis]MCC3298956.1 FAD-binding monooxygenase [Arthrobacter caoxuetaonis]USQ58702.1 FAD-binding monooxygenase [Arthrobacter caoxuetaonis]
MQFYSDGYRPGDPDVRPAAPGRENGHGPLPAEVDVLIVGTGPAGVVLAAQLAAFPGITTRVVERRGGPLAKGQADGVACRTVEMFEAFGLADKLVREAYWVNETTFWGPTGTGNGIERTGRVQDVADGLSEYPHVIVNQARMQDYLLEYMRNSPTRLEPDYGLEAADVVVGTDGEYPVTVTLRRTEGPDAGEEVEVRAKYVVGCDGARSAVRKSLGIELRGDARNHAWGVMDVLAVTDFPDIRMKSAIQSASGGSILIIPREGGYLVRLYVDLGDLDPADREARSRFTADSIIEAARKILDPYTLEVKDIAWWSVYEVGQRVADRFDDVAPQERGSRSPRVFIAGDACHTHSAKAGQGMNVSMQDGFNLGWKLGAVLQGRSPDSLLDTYSGERQEIAQKLIDFDLLWSTAMAAKPKDPANPEAGGMDAAERQAIFTQGGRFTAGFATEYPQNLITGAGTYQRLATGFPVGERFHSAPVIRLADAKPLELGHQAQADGRWRLYAFADAAAPTDPDSRLAGLCRFLAEDSASPLLRYTPAGSDSDAVFDVRAVYQQGHRDISVADLPALLLPRKAPYGLIDYERVFTPNRRAADIFDARGIDRSAGALVVVRPDQYVAHVLPLDGYQDLVDFFAGILLEARD